MIYVNSINLSSYNIIMFKGEWRPLPSYTVLPENATCNCVEWEINKPGVVSLNPSSGMLRANSAGTARLTVYATDGSGVYTECNISVYNKVDSVEIKTKHKTLAPGERTTLNAKICPWSPATESIRWSSSKPSVADVDAETGEIIGISDGTAIITASAIHGTGSDSCTITVDSREKVIIQKDSHSFQVIFADGKVWKNIGIDLTNREENYNAMYPPPMSLKTYDVLIEEEKRYLDNIYVEKDGVMVNNTYSVNQIAYLYLFDPLGIEYYMRHEACDGKDIASGEFLIFKDQVYEAIFGTSERTNGRFYFTVDDNNVPHYRAYTNCDRMNVYSNAEILFGSHTIFDWSNFWQSIGEFIFGEIPVLSHILLGVEIYKALFFSGSIVGSAYGTASEFLETYAKDADNTVLKGMLGWPKKVFDCFNAIANALVDSFVLNDLSDMSIYAKIQEQSCRTVFEKFESELSISEIISKCSND